MANPVPPAAIRNLSRLIVADNTGLSEEMTIPADERIVERDPSEYDCPAYLRKTAPSMAGEFAELLAELRELNARFAGERTVDVQAILSLTGEHDDLELRFLNWCYDYFVMRGSLDRLNSKNQFCPWLLYRECLEEYVGLIERRIAQAGTLHADVLNLSQRVMLSRIAFDVLKADLINSSTGLPDRFASDLHRAKALEIVKVYTRELSGFYDFLQKVEDNLPAKYLPGSSPEWIAETAAHIHRCSEDLRILRVLLADGEETPFEPRLVSPGIWARLRWDVYHGRSIAAVLTSSDPEPLSESRTNHPLAISRDGYLGHREYPWLRALPEFPSNQLYSELAVSWYILDTLTVSLYEAWDRLDLAAIARRGLEPDATDAEVDKALYLATAGSLPEEADDPQKIRVRPLKLRRMKSILESQFGCEWSTAKGSEQKVYRPGAKHFTFGCHGADPTIHPRVLKRCLSKLNIPIGEFVSSFKSALHPA
jgi:hypothetical protein